MLHSEESQSSPPANQSASKELVLLSLIFALSGVSALTYQMIWQRRLFLSIGVDMVSVTIVVTAFMAGLGLGAIAGGRWADRYRKRCLEAFCGLELCIAVFGVFSFALFTAVGNLHSMAAAGVVAALLLLIPTSMMGATLPLLSVAMIDRGNLIGKAVGTLYYWNSFGGALACSALGFLFFNHFGLRDAQWGAAALNLLVALAALALSRRLR